MSILKKNKQEASPFKVRAVSPEDLSPEEMIKSFDIAMKNLKKLEKAQRGKTEVELVVNHSDPIEVILAGDLHIGSFATNKQMCDNLKKYLLSNKNAVLVLMGDEIEGIKARYLTTNIATSITNLQTQLDYFYYDFFLPLADAGKIAGMVTGYWGHPGWANDETTINIAMALTRNHKNVPIIANGGKFKVRFKNGQTVETQIFHNPPGSSQIDPIHGLRTAAQKQNPGNRPDNFASGHLHRAMVSTENYPGVKKPTNFVQAGTPKSSVKGDNTDVFGERLGLAHTDPWVQGVVMKPKKGRGNKTSPEIQYPFISAKQGSLVFAALELLNTTEQNGSTRDILGQIHNKFPNPQVEYSPHKSSLTSSPIELLNGFRKELNTKNKNDRLTEKDIRPLYESIFYHIQSSLPITVHAISNARLGSYHERGNNLPVQQFVKEISENPYAFTIYLRSMIDSKTAGERNRLEILQKYIDLIKLMDKKTLGVMLDGALGHNLWLKRLGKEDEQRPLAAGSYLSAETAAKLIHHMSMINLSVSPQKSRLNNTLYSIQVVDKLMRHGSFSSTKGIKRMYDLYASTRPSVIVGGHMPVSGFSQFYDRTNTYTDTPITLSPGWWAKFTDTAGTRAKGGMPGQAVILIPGTTQEKAMIIPTSNTEQTKYMSDAVMLYYGSMLLGLYNKLKK